MAACSVCNHPDRDAIDAALVAGQTQGAVAAAHGLVRQSVGRHAKAHLSASLRAVHASREASETRASVDRLEGLYRQASDLLAAAGEGGNLNVSLNALKELRAVVMDLAKLRGEYDDKPTVQVLNVATSPEWLQVRTTMLEALQPFPEARAAVAAALTAGAPREVEA